jgi:hypothetical protein
MSQGYFLDPYRVAAAMSLVTPELDAEVRALGRAYRDRSADEYLEAVSEYLIAELGIERIEARYHLMQVGEYPWPPLFA